MSELLDKMTQQFDQMKAIAEENYKMAEQAIRERDAARDALRECVSALEFYADERRYWGPNQNAIEGDRYAPRESPYIHDVTKDCGKIANAAIQTAKSILGDK